MIHKFKSKVQEKLSLRPDSAATDNRRITNDTVAEHKEEILGRGRRFIYPLAWSKHRIALVSVILAFIAILVFIGLSGLAIYRYKSESNFIYQVSKIIPYPLGRVDGRFVSYESYLFELRHNKHYLSTQKGVDFNSPEGQAQLQELRKQALERVQIDVLVRGLAKQYNVTVTDEELNEQIALFRSEVGSDKRFDDVLSEFYGWTEKDLRRELKLQLLKQKLPQFIDKDALSRAQEALGALQGGADFATIAKSYSDDTASKEQGGEIGLIERTTNELPKEFIDTAFTIPVGQFSELVKTPLGYHIIRKSGIEGDSIRVAHIFIAYKDIDQYLGAKLKEVKLDIYVSPK